MTALTYDAVAEALLSSNWIFAKTMPETPHWYTLRKHWTQDIPFPDAVQFIRDVGYREKYGGRWYHRININGFKYWSMGAALDITILINRARLDAPEPYDAIADTYDAMWSGQAAQDENRDVIAALDYQGGSVLDIGCGTGLFLDHVKPDAYLGIDPSGGMLQALAKKHPNAETMQTTLECYYANGRRFDNIVGLFAAPSYVDPVMLGERVRQLLAPGGRFFLMFYREGYRPVTHQHLKVPLIYHRHDPELLPGRVWQLGNFDVVEG